MRIYTGLDVNADFGGRFPWKSTFVDHGGVKQAYTDEGPRDAEVTFVCLHGNPTWGFLYREFIKDWGGPIGMGWATRHPENVAGVVVLNTTAFVKEPVPNLPWLFKLLTGGWKRAVENNFFVEMFVARVGTVRKMTKEDLDPYRAPFPVFDDRMGIARMPNIWEGGNPGYETYEGAAATEEALPRLHDKPALICWALGPCLSQTAPDTVAARLCKHRRPAPSAQSETLSPGRCSTGDSGPYRGLARSGGARAQARHCLSRRPHGVRE